MIRFCRYQLRTTDIPAARAFYSAVIELGGGATEIDSLPASRGSPSATTHGARSSRCANRSATARRAIETLRRP